MDNPFLQFVTPKKPEDENPFLQFAPPAADPGLQGLTQPVSPERQMEVDAAAKAPPRYTVGGMDPRDLPKPLREMTDQLMEFSGGFNQMLANTAGMAVDDVDMVLRDLGTQGFLDVPGDGTQAVKDTMAKLKIAGDPKEVDSFAANLGRNTFQNLMMLGIALRAAPWMANMPVKGLPSQIASQMGKTLTQTPTPALALTEAGATVGQTAGEKYGGPAGGIVGSVLGAGAGSTALTRMGMQALTASGLGGLGFALSGGDVSIGGIGTAAGLKFGKRLNEAYAKMFIRKEAEPLLPARSAEDAREYARSATEQAKQSILSGIRQDIEAISGKVAISPRDAGRMWRKSGLKAYKAARTAEDKLWALVDGKLDMSGQLDALRSGIKKQLAQISLLNPSAQLPPITIKPAKGKPMGLLPYLNKLKVANLADFRGLSSELGGWLRQDIPQAQKNTIQGIKDMVDNLVTSTYPIKKEIAAASDYTRWINDTFLRGPLAPLIARAGSTRSQQAASSGARAAQVVRDERAGEMVKQAAAGGPGGQYQMPALEQDATDFITSVMRRQADNAGAAVGGDPTKAASAAIKFMGRDDVKELIQHFPKAEAQFRVTANNLKNGIQEMKIINDSAFQRLADQDAETFINSLMSDPKKDIHSKELMTWLSKDENALNGFKQMLVQSLMKRGGDSPSRLNDLIASRDINTMLYNIFGPQDMKRFDNILKAAMEVETRASAKVNSLFLYAFRSRGAQMAKDLGYSTIQQSGYGADIGARVGNWITSDYPAGDLFAMALTNPKMEKLLFSKAPQTLAEMRSLEDNMRKTLAAIGASNAAFGYHKD